MLDTTPRPSATRHPPNDSARIAIDAWIEREHPSAQLIKAVRIRVRLLEDEASDWRMVDDPPHLEVVDDHAVIEYAVTRGRRLWVLSVMGS